MAAFTLCRTFFLLLIALLAATSALPLISRVPAHPPQTLESLPDTRQARQVDCTGESCNSTVNVNRTSNDNSNSNASSQGCLSLEQRLAEDFGEVKEASKSLFPFFAYPEIYLDFEKDRSITAEQKHLENCETLQRGLTREGGICSWSYTCEYKADEFPHYQIQATNCSKPKDSLRNRIKCQPLTQLVHFAKKENGCWNSADKYVNIGCKCKEITQENNY